MITGEEEGGGDEAMRMRDDDVDHGDDEDDDADLVQQDQANSSSSIERLALSAFYSYGKTDSGFYSTRLSSYIYTCADASTSPLHSHGA